MIGINAHTGTPLEGLGHLRQSVRDILTTPIGSRVMRRDYGSRLPELVDAPMNEATRLDLLTATVEALSTWEPRLEVLSVDTSTDAAGVVALSMVGRYLPDGQEITIDGIEVR